MTRTSICLLMPAHPVYGDPPQLLKDTLQLDLSLQSQRRLLMSQTIHSPSFNPRRNPRGLQLAHASQRHLPSMVTNLMHLIQPPLLKSPLTTFPSLSRRLLKQPTLPPIVRLVTFRDKFPPISFLFRCLVLCSLSISSFFFRYLANISQFFQITISSVKEENQHINFN